jgi:hypothetical protein
MPPPKQAYATVEFYGSFGGEQKQYSYKVAPGLNLTPGDLAIAQVREEGFALVTIKMVFNDRVLPKATKYIFQKVDRELSERLGRG